MRNRLFTLILLFSAVLLSACNGAAPISPGVDECTVATQTTDCKDPAKPVCKDDGTGKMTCQAKPSSGDKCTVATQTTDCKDPAKPVCKDDGTGKMTCQAKPSSGDECTDNNGCMDHSKPYCDTSASPKVCRAAKSVDECKTLNPNPGVCEKVTYDATSGCGVAEKAADATTKDSCCPAGADHTTDADCPAAPVDCSTDASVCTGATPICKDAGGGKKTCQAASGQSDCDNLVPSPNTMCVSYTYNAGACDKTEGARAGDSCCPQTSPPTYSDTDADCPAAPVTCTDSTQCTDAGKPICDTGTHACRAANDQADCDKLVPASNTMCVSYTYNAGKCDKGTLSTLTNGDGCCPAGGIHSKDDDCADECTVATQTADCPTATPVCKDDGSGKMTCQAAPATCTDSTQCTDADKPICDTGTHACRAANDQTDCDKLVPASNTMCVSYTYNGGKCDKGTLSTLTNGDGCCPAGGIHSKDDDCADECTVATQSTDCPSATPVCKDDGHGKMTCQAAPATCTDSTQCTDSAKPICDTGTHACRAANDQADCDALSTDKDKCEKYTYDSSKHVCNLESGNRAGDSCCPKGSSHTDDADCDECTDNTGCSGATPICDTGASPKVCRAAKSVDECKALNPSPGVCEKVTYDATSGCGTETITTAQGGDGCCPSGATHATDRDCPAISPATDECTDNNGCKSVSGKPICDTSVSPKVCRAAKDLSECEALNPSPGVCKKVTYDATSGCGMESITTDKNNDGCCLPGHYSDVDNDCPVKCSIHSDCTDPAKPICLEDAHKMKVCQAPLTAKVGGACLQDDDCGAGGFCMTEKAGYPGGYCVIPLPGCSTDSKICSTNIGVSGKTSECVTVSISTSSFDMCFQGCSSDKDCRSGYACDSTGDHSCWPNVVSFKVDKPGQDCNTADDCQEDPSYHDDRIECKKAPAGDGDTWRNGYCTADCSADPGVCPTGMTCADVDGQKRCLVSCDPVTNAQDKSLDTYGRPAYMCVELPGGGDSHKGVYVSKKGVGAPCDSNLGTPGNNTSQIDGTCQVGYQCKEGTDFPGGYCVSTASSCPAGSDHFNSSSECYKTCTTDDDCRKGEGYTCIEDSSNPGHKFCLTKAPSTSGGAGSKELGEACTQDDDCKTGSGMVCYMQNNGNKFCTIADLLGMTKPGDPCYGGKGKYYQSDKPGKCTGSMLKDKKLKVCFPKATAASDCKAPLTTFWNGVCAD